MTILQKYQEVSLVGDVMCINDLRLFVSSSRHIKFITSEFICNGKEDTLFNCIKKIKWLHRRRGFNVSSILLYSKFDFLELRLLDVGITLNTCSNDEHVGEIKCLIRTVKEWVRGTYNTLPFKKVLRRMIIELVSFCVFWLNSSFPLHSIVKCLSPCTIITGLTVNYNKNVKHEFGQYV